MQDISPSETGESAIAHDGPLVTLHSPTSYHQDGKEICPNTQVLPTSVSLAKQPKNPVAESKVALEIPATDKVDKRQRSHNGRRKDYNHEQQRKQRREKKINMRRQQVMCQVERVQDSEPTALHTQYQLPEFEFLEIIGSHDMPLDLAGFESMKLSETDSPSTTSTTQISESCPTVASSSTSGQVGITAPHERRSNFTAPIARSVNVQTLAQSDCTVDIFRPNGAIASPFRYFVPPSAPNNISPRPVTASELQALPSILHHRYGLQSMCIRPTCPIVGWHNEGIYLPEGV